MLLGVENKSENLLKSLMKMGVTSVGIYLLSNLAIFKARNFITPGLTEEQLDLMDKHNATHSMFESAIDWGSGLIGTEESSQVLKKSELGIKKVLNSQTEFLPEPFNHTH